MANQALLFISAVAQSMADEERYMIALETLESTSFTGLVGQPFTVQVNGTSVELHLLEATPLGAAYTGALRAPFALTFGGPLGLRLPQGIYALENSTLGVMEIFLTELGTEGVVTRFEAIFT